MLAASILFSCSDTMAKYVTQTVPAVELAAIRYLVFVLMASVPLWRSPHRVTVYSRRPGLQVVRGLGVAGSALFFILSLGRLPIAEASAINFINPLLITVLAIPMLGEVVRPQGWLAVGIGFIGMLIVVRPGAGGLPAATLLVVASSVCWSVAMLVTRRLVGVDPSAVTLFWTAVTGLVVLAALLPFNVQAISLPEAGFCLAVGVVASLGQWCAVLAYRHAAASVLAPLSYAQLIWSATLGWLVFAAVPDRWVLVGGVVIAISGVYVLQLERRRVASVRAGAAAPS